MLVIDNIVSKYESKIGKVSGTSSWIRIDQKIINSFAEVTMDNQFIHLDTERTLKETNFGSTIAHGFLVLSLSTKFFVEAIEPVKNERMGINYGFNKVRFVHPVKCGNYIRGVFKLNGISKKSENNILFNHNLTIEIKNVPKPAVVCEWLNLSVL